MEVFGNSEFGASVAGCNFGALQPYAFSFWKGNFRTVPGVVERGMMALSPETGYISRTGPSVIRCSLC